MTQAVWAGGPWTEWRSLRMVASSDSTATLEQWTAGLSGGMPRNRRRQAREVEQWRQVRRGLEERSEGLMEV